MPTRQHFSRHLVEVSDAPAIKGDICNVLTGDIIHPPKETKGGGFFELLLDEADEEVREPVVIKRTLWAADADLMAAERQALNDIRPAHEPDEKFLRYFPRLISHPTDPDGPQVHVLSYATGMVTLEEVMKAYPNGLDIRDFAWIFKRILAGIGYAHHIGYVHAALLPPHVMVHPSERGAKLIDWCYSVKLGTHQSVRAYVKRYADFYPPEVIAKRFPTPALDVFMAAKLGVMLLGGDTKTNQLPDGKVPPEIGRLLQVCLADSEGARRKNAWDLHEEFDKVFERAVEKPTYRVLKMP